ncbi:MAG: GrpB family protein [Ruthenibacterium lactatiformans]
MFCNGRWRYTNTPYPYREQEGAGWSNYISFRDYLNANPKKAMMYDEFKRKSAVRFADDRKRYTASKQEIIGQLLSEANM